MAGATNGTACLELCTPWSSGQLRAAQQELGEAFPHLPLQEAAPALLRARRCQACVRVSQRMASMSAGAAMHSTVLDQ